MHKLKLNYIRLNSNTRLYNAPLPIIGLTGGIATGKSTASTKLKQMGIPVIDADQLVKKIYHMSETIVYIRSLDPKFIQKDDSVDFSELRKTFFSRAELKSKIEEHIYQNLPYVFDLELQKMIKDGQQYIVYDVPLLFEKKLAPLLDLSLLIYCPEDIQRQRLKTRDKIDETLIDQILKAQLPIEDKRQLADIVVDNTSSVESLENEIENIIQNITDSK